MAAGPYQTVNTGDANLQSIQRNVADFASQLEDARRGVPAFPSAIFSKAAQLREEAVAIYRGDTATLSLPSAHQRGRGRSQLILVLHEGMGTLTLAPSSAVNNSGQPDTLTPAVALTAGQSVLLVSDGYTRWFPVPGAFGPGTTPFGPWIRTLTLDATGRVSAVGVGTPVTGAKATGAALITGDVEIAGAGCVTTAEAGQIITITGRDGRSFESYVHAPGGSGLTNFTVAGVNKVSSTGTNAICTANQMVAIPFIAPQRGGTLDRIEFNVGVLGAGNGRAAIYANTADNNLYPAGLLADGGSFSTGATGSKTATVSVALTGGGLYWAVYNTDNATALIAKLNGTDIASVLGQAVTFATSYNCAISVTQTFGAMPGTFPAGGAYVLSTASVPWLRLRIS